MTVRQIDAEQKRLGILGDDELEFMSTDLLQ